MTPKTLNLRIELYVKAKKARKIEEADASREKTKRARAARKAGALREVNRVIKCSVAGVPWTRRTQKPDAQRKAVKNIRAAKRADATWELNSAIRRRMIYAQAEQVEDPEVAQKSTIERNAVAAGVNTKMHLKRAADRIREVRAIKASNPHI